MLVGVLIWYPGYLSVQIGTLDLMAARIVIPALLLRCLLDTKIRSRFTWSKLDTWVTISMVVYVGMYFLTRPFSLALENRGGFILGTWFMYLITRMIITDKKSLVAFTKTTGILLVGLAILGVIESTTHHYFFQHLKRFRTWGEPVENPVVMPRWGLYRAIGPFSHSIMFGTCFTLFVPFVWMLRHEKYPWKQLGPPFTVVMMAGALSSMSSNAWMSAIFVILLLWLGRRTHLAKPLLKLLAAGCIAVEVLSNRRFYHVLLQYGNPISGTWWQRAKLMDIGIETIGEWWLAGYKGRDPGWGPRMGMGHTDMNNEFLLMGVKYGIWGVIVFCIVLGLALYMLVRFHRRTNDPTLKAWAWALGASLVSMIITFQAVSLFGQNISLFYLLLGSIGSLASFQTQPRTVAAPARAYAVQHLSGQPSIGVRRL